MRKVLFGVFLGFGLAIFVSWVRPVGDSPVMAFEVRGDFVGVDVDGENLFLVGMVKHEDFGIEEVLAALQSYLDNTEYWDGAKFVKFKKL